MIALGAFAGACESGHPTGACPYGHEAVIKGDAARCVPVVTGDGRTAAWSELVNAASQADVIVLGENHGHVVGLSAAAALWEDVLARSDNAALAMEFLERDQQAKVNDYLTGIIDEAGFEKATGQSGPSYPPGHQAMVDAAKEKHRPVYAANAPRVYVRLARTDGFMRMASLTTEQKRLFRVPDELPPEGSKYRQEFAKVMGQGAQSHGAAAKTDTRTDAEKAAAIEASFRSQSVWDWTMAETVANAASAGNTPVCLVVGRFHTDFDGGLVQALRKMRPGVKVVVVSFVDALPPEGATIREEDRGRGDFVVYVGRQEE
jgi:uncharacterized iron-regulated protein